MNYKQQSFKDGMDMLSKDDTDMSPFSYRWLINGRTRYGWAEANRGALDITFNLQGAGNFQGIYSTGNIWLCFFSGKAYYMAVGGTQWFLVPNLQMDATVPYIYVAAVTGSTNNFLRQANSVVNPVTGLAEANAAGPITQVAPFAITGLPAGIVVQDGINQPWLITYDNINNNATARVLGNYAQWDNTGNTSNNREYVPIGLQMMFSSDGILYIVAPSGNQIYRSVSGRPLDFMINIDTNGNKLLTESLGGASTTSFGVSFDTITALQPSIAEAGTFLVCTGRFVYGMQPNFATQIFDEPTFIKAFTLDVGVVNQFCLSDKNGDTSFIDFEGVKFFNSVQSLKFEGRNDPLSKQLALLLQNISQNICCSIVFDNYNLFALNTIWGYVIAVFDNLINKWVALDVINACAGGIKMFAEAVTVNNRFLACGNSIGKLWQLYAVESPRETAEMQMRGFVSGDYYLGNFIPGSLSDEHKLTSIRVLVQNGVQSGSMVGIEQVDEQVGQVITKQLNGTTCGVNYPIRPPVIANNKPRIQDLTFPEDQGLTGYKINPILTWNSDCKVFRAEVNTSTISSPQSQKEQEATSKAGK